MTVIVPILNADGKIGPMWCIACQSEVSETSSENEGRWHCAQCGHVFDYFPLTATEFAGRSSFDPRVAPIESSLGRQVSDTGIDLTERDPVPAELPMKLNDWESEERLRDIQKSLQRGSREKYRGFALPRTVRRYDPPPPEALQISLPEFRRLPEQMTENLAGGWSSALAWLTSSLGLMAFVCGAVLLGWSYLAQRTDLWEIGMPAALAGQFFLVLGMLLKANRPPKHGRAVLGEKPLGEAGPHFESAFGAGPSLRESPSLYIPVVDLRAATRSSESC